MFAQPGHDPIRPRNRDQTDRRHYPRGSAENEIDLSNYISSNPNQLLGADVNEDAPSEQDDTAIQSSTGVPEPVVPCSYLKDQVGNLSNNRNAQPRLKALMDASAESDEAITTEYGKWLLIDEVLLAIASVAMAISSIRGPSRSFSIIPPRDMEVCCQYAVTLHQLQLDKAVRRRSPMIVPYLGQAFHTVLLVIELDEKDEVVINVLDSRFWTFEKHQREEVLEAAWAATRVSGWCEGGTEPKVPKYAT
jgi:hypothetical protein